MKPYPNDPVQWNTTADNPHEESQAIEQQARFNTPQVRRYAHPIETAPRAMPCSAMHSILCTLAGQNQLLCTMKAELDEILARLQEDPCQSSEP